MKYTYDIIIHTIFYDMQESEPAYHTHKIKNQTDDSFFSFVLSILI